MTGVTHAALGALAGAATTHLAGAGAHGALTGAIAGLAGGLLPDLDHPGSLAWKTLGPAAVLAGAAAALTHAHGHRLPPEATTLVALVILSATAGTLTGHRGATHSLVWLALAAAICSAARAGLHGAAITAGVASHLLADLLTPGGVPLLWPRQRRYQAPLARVGGPLDLIVGAAAALAALRLVFR